MRQLRVAVAFACIALVSSPSMAKKPILTPMELQALQSREYKTTKENAFSSVVSVFQDMGYQISAADMSSGFITAGSPNKNKTSFFEAMGGMMSSGASRVTAFVETMPSGMTKVRLNFMNTKNSSSLYGGSSAKDTPILEQKTYQVAFERVEEALFERGALTKTGTDTGKAVPLVASSPQQNILSPAVSSPATSQPQK